MIDCWIPASMGFQSSEHPHALAFSTALSPQISPCQSLILPSPLTPPKVCTGDGRVKSVQQILCKSSHEENASLLGSSGTQWLN